MRSFDLTIIGNGAAAFAGAIKASELSNGKASILMVGKGSLGGTCVNVGCVPSKYLLELSHHYFYPTTYNFPGLKFTQPEVDFRQVMDGLRGLVGKLRKEKYQKVLRNYPNVEVIDGTAYFTSREEIVVQSDDQEFEVRAKHHVIATGSRPIIPPIDGIDKVEYLTSDSIWQLNRLPDSTIIVGGGAIGLELGQALQHFGSQVSVLEAAPRIIYQAEPEMSQTLQSILEDEGMSFYLNSNVLKVRRSNGGVKVDLITNNRRSTIEGETLLLATGRRPNTDKLQLQKANVNLDDRGAIRVDPTMMTSNPTIYAAGDVTSKNLMLETLAAKEGVTAAMNIYGDKVSMDYSTAPWVVFTSPNLAVVGMSEEEVMKTFQTCSCRVLDLKPVAKANLMGETRGLAKLILNPSDNKILGAQVLAPFASEFITEIAIAIKKGMTHLDIINTTHVFPSMNEVLKMTAQTFVRDIGKMSCCVE